MSAPLQRILSSDLQNNNISLQDKTMKKEQSLGTGRPAVPKMEGQILEPR
jgi:hypothetical protein